MFSKKHSDLSGKPVELFQNEEQIMISSIKLISLLARGREETKTSEATLEVTCLIGQTGIKTYYC